MYRIDKNANRLVPLTSRSFCELGFQERRHLQEWIANEPAALGEDLLIIQKEFAGFSDTYERLDLLALDRQGSLVIIENKLDDTGRDVTWQALKYASYCAALTKNDILRIFQEHLDREEPGAKAEERLCEFFEASDVEDVTVNSGFTQRIILVAARFRTEVTSTVLWLSNFRLRVQCFKVTPYSMGDDLYMNVEQIIPTKDAEEFMIGLADKARDEVEGAETEQRRHGIRRRFWTQLIKAMNVKSNLYQNISPSTQSWIAAGSGTRGVALTFAATQTYGRSELYIDRGDKVENKAWFDALHADREAIERDFEGPLEWERLDTKRACRIKAEAPADVFDAEQWPAMIEFMTESMVRMERALKPRLAALARSRVGSSTSADVSGA
jgi:hypothetical protein